MAQNYMLSYHAFYPLAITIAQENPVMSVKTGLIGKSMTQRFLLIV